MVFQKPNPFPAMSIYDNVVAGLQLTGTQGRSRGKDALVEAMPAPRPGLWNEVKDRLRQPGGGALRWAAAAAVHRPVAGGAAEGAAHGRAVLGAGPDLHSPDRADDRRAAPVDQAVAAGVARSARRGRRRRRRSPRTTGWCRARRSARRRSSDLSSMLTRSSPQPPRTVSRPVPPTTQSLPRSPKIMSLPSVGTAA